MVDNLDELLNPKHLITEDTSDEELKKQVAGVGLPEKPEADPDKPNPRGEKSYTFQVDYKDARGKVWKGQFTNKILSIHERQQVGVMRSMLSGGQPIPSLDPMTIELNLIVAHLAYSLTEKPEWAANLRSLEDPGVLQAIYTEVDSHESYFLGWGTPQGSGEESH